ncbi:D-alanyl-D-alanine carboxypeptidase (penicillin-binding protein 4) [Bernardetia litoralis DSM 6794]|uniref:D-alanyl-D-alanine carboxypeptidase (Penicillin-binding protein 4) n=1 Tax=Bernardetia litoralis (strain ATCC 23117 / DSM 6794 / NBRC 15988 / NCIMB 1366 / Fx l1 / Sio-4) TaxID=880071 RepID=I4AGX4_BERLS|nr:D-alanyl-D-alanine carboxypeptidase [Bernardetia litoralis]AFM03209.1 D-alanyl-D-alanine carboxypeptidase (penicillin-binding protein 4) [Bernardetia litoralis DSM 6794]
MKINFIHSKKLLLSLLISFCLISFSSIAQHKTEEKNTDYISNLNQVFQEDCFRDSFHGFVLYDLDSSKYLFEYNADKYFTPASNVKIASLFAATKILNERLPSLTYFEKGDSLIFWGTGDPTFLHPIFRNSAVIDFLLLKSKTKKLFFSTTNYEDEPFGDGWAWEDYRTSYGIEKSAFPIYGNAVYFEADPSCEIEVFPEIFKDSIQENSEIKTKNFTIKRDLGINSFEYNIGDLYYKKGKTIPFHITPELITTLLNDKLDLEVTHLEYPMPENTAIFYTAKSDKMYKRMMQRSDNFLAEQTLLMCSAELFGTLSTQRVINYLDANYFNKFYNKPRWVDGSGLSRYNLFTPRNFVEMLKSIRKDMGEEKLFETLAIGGKAGTLRRRYEYPKKSTPFLYGKTGTISNNHCLSGFIVTKTGRKLCFSFQNNHHRESSKTIGNKMEEILTRVYKEY